MILSEVFGAVTLFVFMGISVGLGELKIGCLHVEALIAEYLMASQATCIQ